MCLILAPASSYLNIYYAIFQILTIAPKSEPLQALYTRDSQPGLFMPLFQAVLLESWFLQGTWDLPEENRAGRNRSQEQRCEGGAGEVGWKCGPREIRDFIRKVQEGAASECAPAMPLCPAWLPLQTTLHKRVCSGYPWEVQPMGDTGDPVSWAKVRGPWPEALSTSPPSQERPATLSPFPALEALRLPPCHQSQNPELFYTLAAPL